MVRNIPFFINGPLNPIDRTNNPINPIDKIGTGWLFGFLPTANMGGRPGGTITSTTPNPDVPSVGYIGNGLGGGSSNQGNAQGSFPGGGGFGDGNASGGGGGGLVIVEY